MEEAKPRLGREIRQVLLERTAPSRLVEDNPKAQSGNACRICHSTRRTRRTIGEYDSKQCRPVELRQDRRLPEKDKSHHPRRLRRSLLASRRIGTYYGVSGYRYRSSRRRYRGLCYVLRILRLYETRYAYGCTDGATRQVHILARCLPCGRRRTYSRTRRTRGTDTFTRETKEPQRTQLYARASPCRCRRDYRLLASGDGEYRDADGYHTLEAEYHRPTHRQTQCAVRCIRRIFRREPRRSAACQRLGGVYSQRGSRSATQRRHKGTSRVGAFRRTFHRTAS